MLHTNEALYTSLGTHARGKKDAKNVYKHLFSSHDIWIKIGKNIKHTKK